METGLSVFFKWFFTSFSWGVDGSGPMWLQLIVAVTALFFTVRKDHSKSKQFVKLMFIVSFWGTLYGIILSCAALSNPALSAEQRPMMLLGGLGASLISLIFAVIIWFVITLVETFIGQPKPTT